LLTERLGPSVRIRGPIHAVAPAAHPRLHDEADCRTRLLELGLLTSSACRIEFPPEVAERSDPAA